MSKFDLNAWWDEHVDPEKTPLDDMYKKITEDAIEAMIDHYGIRNEINEKIDPEGIDVDDLDLSSFL